MHSKEFSGNQGKHQNFDPSILPCGSTYMAVRLSDISSKTGKKCNFFFCFIPMKISRMVEWMGQNFDAFPGFQKIPCYVLYSVHEKIKTLNIFWASKG